jgi:hypothetical protein
MVREKLIDDNPIDTVDLKYAQTIFGHNLAGLRGRELYGDVRLKLRFGPSYGIFLMLHKYCVC